MRAPVRAHTFVEADHPHPIELEVAGGTAVVISMKSPERDGPNEDAALVQPVGARAGLLAVADGAGGMPLGARAAKLAVRALAAAGRDAEDGADLRASVLDAFEAANAAVQELKVGAATTLAVVEVAPAGIRTYHVGDSGILVVGQRGKVKLQTVAHSLTGYAVEAGFLEPEAALHHDDNCVVLNLVGNADMRIELGSVMALSPRDTVLVASDGLLDNLRLEEIVEIVRCGALKVAAARLAEACRARMLAPEGDAPSKPDDLTAVLFRRRVRRSSRPGSTGSATAP